MQEKAVFVKNAQSLAIAGVEGCMAGSKQSTCFVDNLVDIVDNLRQNNPQTVDNVDNSVDKCG